MKSKTISFRFLSFHLTASLLILSNAFAGNNQIEKQQTENWILTPFHHKVFIENKGQFFYEDANSEILYGICGQGANIYFTSTGLIYHGEKFDIINTKSPDYNQTSGEYIKEPKNSPTGKKIKEDKYKKIIAYNASINIEWLYANPNVKLVAEDPVKGYFNYMNEKDPLEKSIYYAKAFKKLIYKDLYPGIDVEYLFHEKEGIKYNLIIHPGADPSNVKFRFKGSKNIYQNKQGDIHIVTSLGDIVDHAPYTFYENSKTIISSSFKLEGNITSFELDNYDRTKTIIIDPWLIVPTPLTADFKAFEVAKDAGGNVYVYGGINRYKLAKYTPAGVHLWTFNTNYGGGISSTFGDLVVDPTGNSYIMDGFTATGTGRAKISPAGTVVWAVSHVMYEHFNLAFNCDNTQLAIGGRAQSTAVNYGDIGYINLNTGAITNLTGVGNSEIRSMTVSPNGNIYSLTCLTVSSNAGNLLIARTPAIAPIYSISSGYAWLETGVNYSNGVTIFGTGLAGQNGIASDYCYLYTTNGTIIEKRKASDGSVIASSVIPGGIAELNSGVAVDSCGNIYVGSQSAVYKFGPDLTLLDFASTGSPVYCVSLGMNGEILSSGNGFVASLNLQSCNKSPCIPSGPGLSFTKTDASCSANNGIASVQVAGSSPPFTYSWSNGGNTQTINNLSPGNYSVTVTTGCTTLTGAVIINDIQAHTIAISATHVSCNGGSDGTATANVTGGSGSYTYLWSPSGNTTDAVTNLSAGSYILTVTDNNGCALSETIVIEEPALITATVTTTPADCGSSNGSATLIPTGGISPYSYEWLPGGELTPAINNIPAGSYTCTVKDSYNCSRNFNVIVNNLDGPDVMVDMQVNVTCNGGKDGSATVSVSGGQPPYSYSWTSGDTIATALDLSEGTYNCMVTDLNGCLNYTPVTITSPPEIKSTFSITKPTCNSSDGSATITPYGGIPSYSYSWFPHGGNDSIAENLSAGIYTCTIKDMNECSKDFFIHIIDSEMLIASIESVQHVSCFDGNNGNATVKASGGKAPYTYSWSPNGGTNTMTSGLKAGKYICTVTDADGCYASDTAVITAPLILSILDSSVSPEYCENRDGMASVEVTGGTGPYTYYWNTFPVQNTSAATNLSAGDYYVSILDSKGCPLSLNITVPQIIRSDELIFTADVDKGCVPHCVSFNCITADIQTITWDFGDGNFALGKEITHCYTKPGFYDLVIESTDNNGCMQTDTLPGFIQVFEKPVADFIISPSPSAPVSKPVTFTNYSTGAANWLWSFGNISNSTSTLKDPVFNYDESGNYTVTLLVSNNEACTDTISKIIHMESGFLIYIPNTFTPDEDGINDSFAPKGVGIESYEMEIYNRWGERIEALPNSYPGEVMGWDGTVKGGVPAPAGIYVYKILVKDFKGETHYYVGNVTLIR